MGGGGGEEAGDSGQQDPLSQVGNLLVAITPNACHLATWALQPIGGPLIDRFTYNGAVVLEI
jgi:hypothetical protein